MKLPELPRLPSGPSPQSLGLNSVGANRLVGMAMGPGPASYTEYQLRAYALAYGEIVREECAKLALSKIEGRKTPTYWNEACQEIAEAIRAVEE